MRRSRHRGIAWWTALGGPWLVAAGVFGCHADARGEEGRLSARWTGPDTAAFSAPAVAEWCPSLHLLEIRAIAGDTGMAIVLYPADTVGPGTYPVRRPDLAGTAGPPSAAMALRWLSQTKIEGYQSDTGRVSVERTADGSLAGRFAVGARPLVQGARLTATGSFEDLRVVTAPATCAGRHLPDTTHRDTVPADEAGPDTSD